MKVGYARVSTTDQSLDIQREALLNFGCEKVFEEKRSGRKADDRPELKACLEFVREGDTLVVTRVDRLARSQIDWHNILATIAKKGAFFHCIQQPGANTDTSIGRLTLGVLAVVAEFETDLRAERQREGIARAKAEGKYRGRPRRITREMVDKLHAEGLGAAAIAKELGCSPDTVYRAAPGIWGEPPATLRRA